MQHFEWALYVVAFLIFRPKERPFRWIVVCLIGLSQRRWLSKSLWRSLKTLAGKDHFIDIPIAGRTLNCVCGNRFWSDVFVAKPSDSAPDSWRSSFDRQFLEWVLDASINLQPLFKLMRLSRRIYWEQEIFSERYAFGILRALRAENCKKSSYPLWNLKIRDYIRPFDFNRLLIDWLNQPRTTRTLPSSLMGGQTFFITSKKNRWKLPHRMNIKFLSVES